jgi:hypothetical protein
MDADEVGMVDLCLDNILQVESNNDGMYLCKDASGNALGEASAVQCPWANNCPLERSE